MAEIEYKCPQCGELGMLVTARCDYCPKCGYSQGY